MAYETAMLGSLRCGYRCLHLRSPSGTRIDSCCLLLHISVSTEPNTFGTADELRSMVQSQRSLISQQSRDIHQLSEELSRLGSQPSTPMLTPGATLTVGRASYGVALFPLDEQHASRQHAGAADGRRRFTDPPARGHPSYAGISPASAPQKRRQLMRPRPRPSPPAEPDPPPPPARARGRLRF